MRNFDRHSAPGNSSCQLTSADAAACMATSLTHGVTISLSETPSKAKLHTSVTPASVCLNNLAMVAVGN